MFGNFKDALPTYKHLLGLQSSEISALVHNLLCKFSWNRQFLHEKHSMSHYWNLSEKLVEVCLSNMLPFCKLTRMTLMASKDDRNQ